MARLKGLSALASIKSQIAISGSTTRRHHPRRQFAPEDYRQVPVILSHIRQPAYEEGWLAVEIGTVPTSRAAPSQPARQSPRAAFADDGGNRCAAAPSPPPPPHAPPPALHAPPAPL